MTYLFSSYSQPITWCNTACRKSLFDKYKELLNLCEIEKLNKVNKGGTTAYTDTFASHYN